MTEKYEELSGFIRQRMQMSHVYQPAMILRLLHRGGRASVENIASFLLSLDQSQVEYYERITKRYPGNVLSKHGIAKSVRTGNKITGFELDGFGAMTADEVKALISFCQAKIDEYVAKRGERIWMHRRLALGDVPGSARYEVLKRAKYRCELCGVSAEERALEVDHIVPRNKGGTDDIENFQALCFSCNATKRDTDDTDFRGIAESYKHRDGSCPFCSDVEERIVAENSLSFVIKDGYPVTDGHRLIIPKRHVSDSFDLYQPERNAIQQLLESQRKVIMEQDASVTGFNVGINAGASAGQTVWHCHVHLIPRRNGDVENPRGGVRGVIAEKQRY